MRSQGFTLMEMLAAVLLLAVLTAIALPQYQRAVENRRREAAIDILRAIYAGERAYWAQNNTFLPVDSTAGTAVADFRQIYTPLPTVDGVVFRVAVSTDGTGRPLAGALATFTATAQRQGVNSFLSVTHAWDPTTKPPGADQTWPVGGGSPPLLGDPLPEEPVIE
ncbi:MAG: prepilin-type N-terminal cleavage/methylation domain-containing protein [Candidatus Omnitrophica bacterium]|nr:prepilin-type N-terminal cleavage/methylation domain-containing protein [Candidatus Omnitrophota bacterium]